MEQETNLANGLAEYLGLRPVEFSLLAGGWETIIYQFSLPAGAHHDALPASQPLVLRCYQGALALRKGAREYAALKALSAAGFPVPCPYLCELDPRPLGTPFLIMARLSGSPMLGATSFLHAAYGFSAAFIPFVRAHVRLHRLATAPLGLAEGAPMLASVQSPTSSLLERVLQTIEQRATIGPLPDLTPVLHLARAGAGAFSATTPALLHLDYHPLNVIAQGRHLRGVLDWVSYDFGDRHLDVATTSTILWTTAMADPRWLRDNPAGNFLRRLYYGLYLALYHAMAPMDLPRLRYYQGVSALLRLSTMGMMRRRGADSVGYRGEALAEINNAVVRLLCRFASRRCQVTLTPACISPTV
ncbi:MAG TPA: phosphotransferase [Candidatus Binataceae bacterium]|nr:phosphotransferase [Candidatus Binataceae bacterium]